MSSFIDKHLGGDSWWVCPVAPGPFAPGASSRLGQPFQQAAVPMPSQVHPPQHGACSHRHLLGMEPQALRSLLSTNALS